MYFLSDEVVGCVAALEVEVVVWKDEVVVSKVGPLVSEVKVLVLKYGLLMSKVKVLVWKDEVLVSTDGALVSKVEVLILNKAMENSAAAFKVVDLVVVVVEQLGW